MPELTGETIGIRFAKDDERFTTLDDVERTLTSSDLLICDNSGGIALAGIMGGLDSEIKDDTCEVVLEAANFDAGVIRRSGTRLGLRTESSARFEKVSIPILLRRPLVHFACFYLPSMD